MHKLTQFQIDKETTLKGEYEGNDKTGRVVIFSHGFGVTRTDHGMFTDLGNELRKDFLIIRFDYNEISRDGKTMTVFPYSVQARKLNDVLNFVSKNFKPREINIVAHSMGSLIAGILNPDGVNKFVLNAMPLNPPYERFKDYFSKRKGTNFNENGLSEIERSDGTVTYIGKDFWPEIKTIKPLDIYSNLARKNMTYIIKAKDDQVVTEEVKDLVSQKLEGAFYYELDGGHDFGGAAREPWINLVKKLLDQ